MDFINKRPNKFIFNETPNDTNNSQQFGAFPNNFERKMQMSNPDYNQIIMKPPRQNVTHGRQTRRLIVDSRDRDLLLYPNPNDYTYEIESEYKDAISARLIKANIPNTSYIINNNNNKFIFNEMNGDTACNCNTNVEDNCCISIREGDYDVCNLLIELTEKMTCCSKNSNNELPVEYKATVDPIQNKIVLFSNFGCTGTVCTGANENTFELIFEECCDLKCDNCNNCCCKEYNTTRDIRTGIETGELRLAQRNPYKLEGGGRCGQVGYNDRYFVRENRSFTRCKKTEYPKNSIGKKLGFDRKNICVNQGTVSKYDGGYIEEYGCCDIGDVLPETAIVGTKTKFLNDVYIDRDPDPLTKLSTYIKICSNVYKVKTVCSDTLLILEDGIDVFGDGWKNGSKYISGTKKAQFKYDLSSDPYIILNIRELEVLDGKASSIVDGFAVIPFYFPHNTKNFAVMGTLGQGQEIKYFNPPERLNKLTIKFKTYEGDLYDFNGLEHMLEFEIMTMNQVGKYNFSH